MQCWNCKRAFNFLTQFLYDEASGLCRDCAALRAELQRVIEIQQKIQQTREEIQQIRAGNLSVVQPSIVLPSTEICYWDTPATYHKVLTASVKQLYGNLVITNSPYAGTGCRVGAL